MPELDDVQLKELGGMVANLCDIEEGLTDWEVNFVDDMGEKFKSEPPIFMTAIQTAKVRELHARHCR